MTPDCEALARLIDPRAFDVINGGLREIMRRDQTLYAAARIIAAGWAPVVVPATPSGAQQVTDEMVEAALAEFIEQDWPRDQSDENAECLRSDMRAALEAAIAVRAIASVAQQLPLSKAGNRQAPCIPMRYTNYRGETAIRHIIPLRVWWGSTEWHPEPDWLLESVDVEKCATRDFALSDADFRTLSAPSPDIHPPCPEGWAALRMIFEAVGELFGPVASLESEEAMLLRGPEMHHAAEAVIEALQRVQSSTAPSPEAIRAQAIEEAALDAGSRQMTKAQEEALRWLRERNGTGVFEMPWASVLVAAGERAPIMRVTWNALHDLGHVTIEGWRVTMTEEPGR